VTLSGYLRALRPWSGSLLAAGLLLIATASIPALGVALVHRAVAAVATGEGDLLALAIVLLSLGHALALVVRTWITKRVAWDLAADLRRRVHTAWLRASPAGALGDRLARLGEEIDQVQYGVSALVTALRNPLTLLGLAGVTLWLAPELAALAIVGMGPVLAVTALGGGLVRRRTIAMRRARADWLALAAAQLGGLEGLQSLGAIEAEQQRFETATRADRDAHLRLDVARTLPRLGVQLLAAGALALLLLAGREGLPGASAGDAAALVAALVLAQRPLAGLAEVWSLLQRSLGALGRVEEALRTPPRIREPAEPRALPGGPLTLRWEGVGWDVDGRTILDDVSLEARPSEILALVGPTGGGKTSLLRLGWRAVDPTRGRVSVGGVDLRSVAAAQRHRAIALVPQDLVLWGRTLRENLTMGLAEVPDDRRLVEALAAARAEPVLAAIGLDGRLAEGGRGLSGGERQRLCLARAFVRDARVWLLDEPTSQVDAETTRLLGETLRRAAPGRTLVIVAHDPGLTAMADRVVRVDGGRVCTGS